MKSIIKKTLVLFIFLFGSMQAFAGSGHSHSTSKGNIKIYASNHLKQLVIKNELIKSWQKAEFLQMREQGFISKEWIVSFKNRAIQDLNKQTIYIYLTTYGKIKGANYKGD